MKLNWPNRLSILRLILAIIVMVLVIVSYYGELRPDHSTWPVIEAGDYQLSYLIMSAGIIFVIASLTDFLDGFLARKNNQVTTLGKFLDPIADKFLVNSVLIMFAVYQILPIWMTTILILRDIFIDFMRMMLAANNVTLAAGIYGKLKTIFQMVGLTILFFFSYINFKQGNNELLSNEYGWVNQMVMIPMYVATFFSIFSGVLYFKHGYKQLFKPEKRHGTV